MAKLRTIIVDDEPLALRLLKTCLSEFDNIELVAECRNGREAVEASLKLNPDLMFLDIQMPGMTGFDVVKHLQADILPMVIFTTAYQQYALDAFDLHAVDYVLKPLEEDRLQRAVERAVERHHNQTAIGEHKPPLIGAIDEITRRVSTTEAGTSQPQSSSDLNGDSERKIAIKDSESVIMVNQCEIDWVDAAGDYMCIHVQGKTHIMRSTMKELLSKLNPNLFKRIHRSTIANLERIEQVTPHTKGEYFLHLDCGEQLKVSRNYREAIKAFLSDTQ